MSIIGYYGSWSFYSKGDGKFTLEDIDPSLCSHLIYAFAGLSQDNKILVLDPWKDLEQGPEKQGFFTFNSLKKSNPNLKTLIAVGGWNEGSIKYSNMVSNPQSRKIFINSVVKFISDFGFDGLDIDWEYPGSRGGVPQDQHNFVCLLKELKAEFTPRNYLLSAAVSAGQSTIDMAYNVSEISKYLNFINVMTYDYHGNWEQKTGHNSPLYARPDETDQHLNVDSTIKYWISKGAPREKLILGIPAYGRTFTLKDPQKNGINAITIGPGVPGPYSNEAGSLGFNEFCELNKSKQWTVVQELIQKVPYAYKGDQWVGYDDVESVTEKAEYAKNQNLAGVMIWKIDSDDFKGQFGERYPLLNAINKVIRI